MQIMIKVCHTYLSILKCNVLMITTSLINIITYLSTLLSGSFCLTNNGEGKDEKRKVFGLCSDQSDKFLVAGDSQGFVTVFDITNYCNGDNHSVN